MSIRPMPDRGATVKRFYADHPDYFVPDDPPGRHDNRRRQSLPALIDAIEIAHPTDHGLWGVLVKPDRNLKVPCDVLVWKPTLQSVDVCDSAGGIWAPHAGSIRDAGGDWQWAPWSVVNIETGDERALTPPPYEGASQPQPQPTPAPTPAPDDRLVQTLIEHLAAIRGVQEQLLTRLDLQAARLAAQHTELRLLRHELRTLEVRGGVMWQDVTLRNVRLKEPIPNLSVAP